MTESFDRRQHRFPESRYFEDLKVGERFYPLRYRILPRAQPPGIVGARLPNPVFHRGGGQQFCACRRRRADRVHRAIVEVSEAGLSGRHTLPNAENYRADAAALDRRRYPCGHGAQPGSPAGALRRTENPAAQAPRRGQRRSMTSASRSAARRHWSALTSR